MLRKLIVATAVLVALAASPAAAQYTFVVTPGTVSPGATVNASGGGCSPGSDVSITLAPAAAKARAATGTEVATGTADDEGNFNIAFQVPAGTAPGEYVVTATCGGQVQSQTITVQEAPSPSTGGGTVPTRTQGGGSLSTTGSNLNGVGLVGAGLLTAGGLVLVVAKRRRTATA